jgi:hypothetical protein
MTCIMAFQEYKSDICILIKVFKLKIADNNSAMLEKYASIKQEPNERSKNYKRLAESK